MTHHTHAERNLLGHYAGFSSRFLAFWIDIILVNVTVLAGAGLLVAFGTIIPLPMLMDTFNRLFPGIGLSIQNFLGILSLSVISLLFYILYNLFFWALTGQTPGKALIGLRIVGVNGQRVHPLRGMLRLVGYFLGLISLGLGFLWILVSNRRQGWHDNIAGTYVIYTWAARPDERFLADEIANLRHNIPKIELEE